MSSNRCKSIKWPAPGGQFLPLCPSVGSWGPRHRHRCPPQYGPTGERAVSLSFLCWCPLVWWVAEGDKKGLMKWINWGGGQITVGIRYWKYCRPDSPPSLDTRTGNDTSWSRDAFNYITGNMTTVWMKLCLIIDFVFFCFPLQWLCAHRGLSLMDHCVLRPTLQPPSLSLIFLAVIIFLVLMSTPSTFSVLHRARRIPQRAAVAFVLSV